MWNSKCQVAEVSRAGFYRYLHKDSLSLLTVIPRSACNV